MEIMGADGGVVITGSRGPLLGHWRQFAGVPGFESIWTDTPGTHQRESYSEGMASYGHEVDG